jgi:hypothetical protein
MRSDVRHQFGIVFQSTGIDNRQARMVASNVEKGLGIVGPWNRARDPPSLQIPVREQVAGDRSQAGARHRFRQASNASADQQNRIGQIHFRKKSEASR